MKKVVVLDANILIRAVLGRNVPQKLDLYKEQADYYTPAFCYVELRKHIPRIAENRQLQLAPILEAIDLLEKVVIPLDDTAYAHLEDAAKRRIAERDIDDWPIVALAMALECPIWTEDQDFFGTGIATWNSRNIEIFLSG